MLVIDASVVVKLLTLEEGAALAVARVAREPNRTAPDLLYIEVASALSKKVRYGGLPMAASNEALAALPLIMSDLTPSEPLLREALEISIALRHALYDCLYLALALREGAKVLTADHKFFSAASLSKYADRVELLA